MIAIADVDRVKFEGPWTMQGQPLDVQHLAALPHQNTFIPTRYVYVAEFASGWVKVGRTVNPRSRMQCHARRKTAVTHPGSMLRCWVSRLTRDDRGIEKLLIALGEELGSERHRNEYFNGCSFDELVAAGTRFVDLARPVRVAAS